MIHVLAAFVHGALSLGHSVGFAYSLLRGQYGRAAFHFGAAGFSAIAAFEHSKEVGL